MYCLCPMWLARVITLVLVLRHSNENHSIWKQLTPLSEPKKLRTAQTYAVIVSPWPRLPGWALLPSQLFVSNLNGLPFFERNCRQGWLARFNSSGRWETLLSGTSFLHINGRDCYFADGQTSAKALESTRNVVVHFVVHLNSVEPHRNSYLSKMVNILPPTLVFRISWGFLVSLP